jgi:putative transposase
MIKGYKIRLYPTSEQEDLMWDHVHAARWIWNWALAYEMELYRNGEKHKDAEDMTRLLTPLKKQPEYAWLNEVSCSTLQHIMRDLGKAYNKFFSIKEHHFSKKKIEKAARKNRTLTTYDLEGHPKFKSRKGEGFRFPVRGENKKFYFDNGRVQLEKLGKVLYRTNRTIPEGKRSNPRISYDHGKWLLSFGIECESQVRQLTDKKMGIDLGIHDLAIVSFGGECFKIPNINKSKRVRTLEHKLKHVQRNLSRKYKVNGNHNKTENVKKVEAQIRQIYYRLANIRKNYIHQKTHRLIELLPYRVTMEDLKIRNMMKDKHRSKSIKDANWGKFIIYMKHKCADNGIEFVQVPTFYPSSKTCSNCGTVKRDLKAGDRVYICPTCGLRIDRDENAALNLERYTNHT